MKSRVQEREALVSDTTSPTLGQMTRDRAEEPQCPCGHHLIRRRPLKSLGEVFKAEGTESNMGLSRHRHSEEAHVVEASAPSTRFRSSHASHTLPTCLSLPLPISNSNSNPPSTSFLILKSEVIPPCWGLTRDSAAPLI